MINGNIIRDIRKHRNLSLQELAQKTELSVSYLSEIERNKKQPSLETIEKIANALNISKEGLLVNSNSASEQPTTLGEKIHLFRKDKNLTLTELASKAGISNTYLCQIESGKVMPAISTLKNIAKALDVCPDTLMSTSNQLGYKVKKARKERGLTQSELAEKAGVSTALIGQIENGKVEPSLKSLEKIADALAISPCYFVADDGISSILKTMNPEIKNLLSHPKVKPVLELLADCTKDEFTFILKFIQLYKGHK